MNRVFECKLNGMKLNPSKCSYITLTLKRFLNEGKHTIDHGTIADTGTT